MGEISVIRNFRANLLCGYVRAVESGYFWCIYSLSGHEVGRVQQTLCYEYFTENRRIASGVENTKDTAREKLHERGCNGYISWPD